MTKNGGLDMDTSSDILVIRDSAGEYYAVPLSELQGYRVPPELSEQAAALIAGDEVTGHGITPFATLFSPPGVGLQSQDKLGNFQVQSLMSNYNEAQTLASSVMKHQNDTNNAVIGKI
jgi:hypothetical protein